MNKRVTGPPFGDLVGSRVIVLWVPISTKLLYGLRWAIAASEARRFGPPVHGAVVPPPSVPELIGDEAGGGTGPMGMVRRVHNLVCGYVFIQRSPQIKKGFGFLDPELGTLKTSHLSFCHPCCNLENWSTFSGPLPKQRVLQSTWQGNWSIFSGSLASRTRVHRPGGLLRGGEVALRGPRGGLRHRVPRGGASVSTSGGRLPMRMDANSERAKGNVVVHPVRWQGDPFITLGKDCGWLRNPFRCTK